MARKTVFRMSRIPRPAPPWVRVLARVPNAPNAEEFFVPPGMPDPGPPPVNPDAYRIVWVGIYWWSTPPRPMVLADVGAGLLWVADWLYGRKKWRWRPSTP